MKKLLLLMMCIAMPLLADDNDGSNNPDYVIGVYGLAGLNIHQSSFKEIPDCPICADEFTGGTGFGLSFGFLFEYGLNDMFSLGLRADYATYDAELIESEATTILVDGVETPGSFDYILNGYYSNFGIEPQLVYKPIDRFNVNLGFRLGFNTKAEFDQVEKIADPDGRGTFMIPGTNEDSHMRERNKKDGEIPNPTAMNMYAGLGVSYDLPMNVEQTLFLSPQIVFQYNFNNLTEDLEWKGHAMRGGLALKYNIQSREHIYKEEIKIDTVYEESDLIAENQYEKGEPRLSESSYDSGNTTYHVTTTTRTDKIITPKVFKLNASVDASGVSEAGEVIKNPVFKVEEFVSNKTIPLLPYVFFEENSSEIPAKYNALPKEKTKGFSISGLYKYRTMETYYEVMNVIASRMKANPGAKLEITGCNSGTGPEKNNKELSRSRAENVRDYFLNVWGIDNSRLKIKARNLPGKKSNPVDDPEKAAENRRVEFSSNENKILEPLMLYDTIRTANPPVARFYPQGHAEAGISQWGLTVYQQANKSQPNLDTVITGPLTKHIDWQMSENMPNMSEDLVYEFRLKDKRGKEIMTDPKTMPLEYISVQKKRRNMLNDKEIDEYSLILFDFDDSSIEDNNKRIIDFIKSRLSPESVVTIIGYTDRTGESDYNKRLSDQRAKATEKAIGHDKIEKTEGLGEEVLLFDNNSPEGRFYCRTVIIRVETPIKNK